jgi:hypothetical protein
VHFSKSDLLSQTHSVANVSERDAAKGWETGWCSAPDLRRLTRKMFGVYLMRQVLLAGLLAVGIVAIVPPSLGRTYVPAPAVAAADTPDRYCLQGNDWGYPGNCEFSTYQQCEATASGTTAGCGENPQYLFEEQRRGY